MRVIFSALVLALLMPAVSGAAGIVAPAPVAQNPRDRTYEQMNLLVDVLNYIQENYADEPDTQQLVYGAASGMVRSLDPFSQFMEPGVSREIKAETEGQFGGIGIRLSMREDWLTVLTPLPGTPAFRAGLLPNDRIVEIDGENAKDLQVADAMDKLRGSPGTKVKISVMRRPAAGPAEQGEARKEIEITRENIKIESVQHRLEPSHVGYLRILEFSAHTSEDFREAMKSLSKDKMTSLVLDLRYNPGGLLTAAVDVAASFLGGEKLVVYTQGRRPESRQELRAPAVASYTDLPLVLLVNEGSASGSEIIAGALQDHHRAVLMGARTFGKASVQSVIPLPDKSGLRLTVAHYYTPNGRSIHRNDKKKIRGGIVPDIEISISGETEEKLFDQWEMIYEPGQKPRSAVKKEEFVRDEVLERAVELLKAKDALSRLKGKET